MAANGTKCLLHFLNIIIAVLSFAIAATALWFFYEVTAIAVLRNSSHYLLDFNFYWPQVIPWFFTIASLFTLCVTICGFTGVKRSKKCLVNSYLVCVSIAAVLLLLVAIISLVFADSSSSDDFLKDAIWDAYTHAKNSFSVRDAFGNLERKLQCCGADSPRDYKNWVNEFPQSCCGSYSYGLMGSYIHDCDFTNKLANERHGCTEVAILYSRIIIKVLSAGSILMSVLCCAAIALAVRLSKKLKKKTRLMAVRHETESEKVLL